MPRKKSESVISQPAADKSGANTAEAVKNAAMDKKTETAEKKASSAVKKSSASAKEAAASPKESHAKAAAVDNAPVEKTSYVNVSAAEAAPVKESAAKKSAEPIADAASESEKPAKSASAPKKRSTASNKKTTKKSTATKSEKADDKPVKDAVVSGESASAEANSAETAAAVETAPVEAAPAEVKTPAEETAAENTVMQETAEYPAPAAEETASEPVSEPVNEEVAPMVTEVNPVYNLPRRSVAFIGSECFPFVKTGGLGDVMYALPRALVKQNCDVRVILPRYACIPKQYQDKMIYRGEFYMDLGKTKRDYYVGIMEYICDGVVYDFIDNQEFFTAGNPYVNLVDDIPKYCFFSKAALAALNYMNWIPDIIHCHDWQAALVPVFLRTLFKTSPVGRAKTVLTIHNLRFQGIYNIPTLQYWTGLPSDVFNMGALKQGYNDANMLKGGLAYADRITTVSGTYAGEIQTPEYGEELDGHLRYHSYKLRGIVNGIDYDMWNPETDPALAVNYGLGDVLGKKKENKRALQQELGLVQDDGKFIVSLISRLTNQKGLDLINAILPQILDDYTQMIVLGTGDRQYEDTFRYYENTHRGMFSACIQYDESRAHRIYAGSDALLVPSRFEPCGLTQLNAMHYGTLPIVRETGGLRDTVEPYNNITGAGNGFTFDRYDAGLLLDAINRAKTEFFNNRYHWDEVVQRDMAKDVSWENSARQYKELYLELTQW